MNEVTESEEKVIEPEEGEKPNYKQQINNIKAVLQQVPKHWRHVLYLWLQKEFGVYK